MRTRHRSKGLLADRFVEIEISERTDPYIAELNRIDTDQGI